jgi:hypothetical protein
MLNILKKLFFSERHNKGNKNESHKLGEKKKLYPEYIINFSSQNKQSNEKQEAI